MIYTRNKSIIVIIFIVLSVLSMSGCKITEKSDIVPTLTMTPITKPAETVTPVPTHGGEPSISVIDDIWVKAYYDYIVSNQYDPFLLLIDLNFDEVPELFNVSLAQGSQVYQRGITFMNGEITPIDNDNMMVSAFVGTTTIQDGEQVWYTRYYPSGLHNLAGSEIDIKNYDCSDLFHITGENLLQISFTNTNLDKPDASSVNVDIFKNGKSVDVASQDKQSIIYWYLNDEMSDYDSDWFNNQRLTDVDLNKLPPLAQFEGNLEIQEQKTANVNLNQCYITTDGENKLDYQLFYNQVMNWYDANQTKQWEIFE